MESRDIPEDGELSEDQLKEFLETDSQEIEISLEKISDKNLNKLEPKESYGCLLELALFEIPTPYTSMKQ